MSGIGWVVGKRVKEARRRGSKYKRFITTIWQCLMDPAELELPDYKDNPIMLAGHNHTEIRQWN